MDYNEDIMIRIRVTREMRDEFKKTCEANDTSMSDLIRGWINDYVATHNTVATNNNVAIDDLVNKVTTKSGNKHYYAKVPLEVFKANGDSICKYEQGKSLKKKYIQNKDEFIIKEVSE